MKCPTDGDNLVSQVYEADIEIDQCPNCGGMWLDHQELERIQGTRQHDYSEEVSQMPDLVGNAYAMALARSEPSLSCPKCKRLMDRQEHGDCSQILFDICPTCRGVWLDKGELRALEVFFEKTSSETSEITSGFLASLVRLFN